MTPPGQLSLVATPIGNLEDITLRALSVLRSCDRVAAEDTRRTLKLLNHFEIEKPVVTLHEHSSPSAIDQVVDWVQKGEHVALVSDAGMPLVSDPGLHLVRRIVEANLRVTAIPGPSAVLTALCLSGFPTAPFIFTGFWPKGREELRRYLLKLRLVQGQTIVGFISIHSLVATLDLLSELFDNRPIAICRELTKQYESIYRGTAEFIRSRLSEAETKGEVTIVLEPLEARKAPTNDELVQEVTKCVHEGLSAKDTVDQLAALLGSPRRTIYSLYQEVKKKHLD